MAPQSHYGESFDLVSNITCTKREVSAMEDFMREANMRTHFRCMSTQMIGLVSHGARSLGRSCNQSCGSKPLWDPTGDRGLSPQRFISSTCCEECGSSAVVSVDYYHYDDEIVHEISQTINVASPSRTSLQSPSN
jgi:hypothetical protein